MTLLSPEGRSHPMRVQLRRTKGWRMPENTVSVARPSDWGNPYRIGEDGSAAGCVALFAADLTERGGFMYSKNIGGKWPRTQIGVTTPEDIKRELRGKNLACWCPLDRPCHADVLLEMANQP